MLPLDDPLTRVLQWWIKVGFFKLKSGTMVSDDEVSSGFVHLLYLHDTCCMVQLLKCSRYCYARRVRRRLSRCSLIP
jgi:hypothetical protein